MSYRFLGMQYSKAINVRLLESRHYVLRQNKKQQPFDLTTWLRFCESCQNGRMGESSPLTTNRYPSLKVDQEEGKICHDPMSPSPLSS